MVLRRQLTPSLSFASHDFSQFPRRVSKLSLNLTSSTLCTFPFHRLTVSSDDAANSDRRPKGALCVFVGGGRACVCDT